MNINNSTTREDLIKLVTRQLVVAGATGNHDRFDIEIVQCIGNPMK